MKLSSKDIEILMWAVGKIDFKYSAPIYSPVDIVDLFERLKAEDKKNNLTNL